MNNNLMQNNKNDKNDGNGSGRKGKKKKPLSHELDEILFKPLLIANEMGETIIFIFSNTIKNEFVMNPQGEVVKNETQVVKIFDVNKTIEHGHSVVHDVVVTAPKEFKKIVFEIEDIDECIEEIGIASSILGREISDIQTELNTLTNLVSCLNSGFLPELDGMGDLSDGSDEKLILAGTHDNLAQIVYKTINTGANRLVKEDVFKIGKVLLDIFRTKIEENAKFLSEEDIKKFKSEIEYKILEALPNHIKAGDININIMAVIEEMDDMRHEMGLCDGTSMTGEDHSNDDGEDDNDDVRDEDVDNHNENDEDDEDEDGDLEDLKKY